MSFFETVRLFEGMKSIDRNNVGIVFKKQGAVLHSLCLINITSNEIQRKV